MQLAQDACLVFKLGFAAGPRHQVLFDGKKLLALEIKCLVHMPEAAAA